MVITVSRGTGPRRATVWRERRRVCGSQRGCHSGGKTTSQAAQLVAARMSSQTKSVQFAQLPITKAGSSSASFIREGAEDSPGVARGFMASCLLSGVVELEHLGIPCDAGGGHGGRRLQCSLYLDVFSWTGYLLLGSDCIPGLAGLGLAGRAEINNHPMHLPAPLQLSARCSIFFKNESWGIHGSSGRLAKYLLGFPPGDNMETGLGGGIGGPWWLAASGMAVWMAANSFILGGHARDQPISPIIFGSSSIIPTH